MSNKVKFAFQPHELQQEIIDYVTGRRINKKTKKPYQYFCATIGRQWGKSWTGKYLALDFAINQGKKVMWVAPALSGAAAHWTEITDLITASKLPLKRMSIARREIYFNSGGSILIRSAVKPENLRGFSLDLLLLDEAAFYHNGDDVWWSVLSPTITTTRGKAVFLTTPNGKNWYYKLVTSAQDSSNPLSEITKVWNFPSITSPRQDVETLEILKQSMPSRKFREEYLAEFLSDGGGVFAGVDRAATTDKLMKPLDGHTYVCGIDIGRNNDATAITFIDKYTREQVYGERFTNLGTVETVRRIITLLDIWHPEIASVEKNGVGEHLITLIKEVLRGTLDDATLDLIMLGDNIGTNSDVIMNGIKLKSIHMDNTKKCYMVERLATDIEYGRFHILSENTDYGMIQIEEMSTYVQKRTANNFNVTYGAQSKTEHDDTVSALYLAYDNVPKAKRFKLPITKKEIINPFQNNKDMNLHASSYSLHTNNR